MTALIILHQTLLLTQFSLLRVQRYILPPQATSFLQSLANITTAFRFLAGPAGGHFKNRAHTVPPIQFLTSPDHHCGFLHEDGETLLLWWGTLQSHFLGGTPIPVASNISTVLEILFLNRSQRDINDCCV